MVSLEECDIHFRGQGAVAYHDVIVTRRTPLLGTMKHDHIFRHYFIAPRQEIGYVMVPTLDHKQYKHQAVHEFDPPRYWGFPHNMIPLKVDIKLLEDHTVTAPPTSEVLPNGLA